jgi:choline dehydrogenase-like flavoprotein
MIALRGLATDYDRWEVMGATGWGWRDVEPAFRALTNDLEVVLIGTPARREMHAHATRKLKLCNGIAIA